MQTPTTIPDSCPPWCASAHHDDGTHVQDDTHILDIYDHAIGISAFQVGEMRGVYLGSDVLTPAEARKAARALLASADAADLTAGGIR